MRGVIEAVGGKGTRVVSGCDRKEEIVSGSFSMGPTSVEILNEILV